MNRIVSLAACGLLSLGLTACSGGESGSADPAAATASPDAAVKSAAEALRQNDVGQFVKLVLPEARYNEAKIKFETRDSSADAGNDAEFEAMMAKLTAADAETALMAELEPQIAQFEAEMAPQMPMMIGMGRGFAAQAIQQNPDFNEDQKKQATEVVDAMAGWLSTVKVTDRGLAKQAISKAVSTARSLDLKTMEQVNALSFDDALAKAGIAFGGLKDVLAVYGMDINATLDSTTVEMVSEQGDAARVRVSYSLLGQAITTEQDMIRENDRWYGKDTMTAIADALDNQSASDTDTAEADDMGDETMEEPAAMEESETATE